MVGRREAQAVGETQPAHAAEVDRVAVGDRATLAAVAARRRAARAGELASVADVVAGTPEGKDGVLEF